MTRVTALGVLLGFALAGNAYGQQMLGSCPVLPTNNIWNTPVDTLPVLSNSTTLVNTIGATRGFHADFGSGTWDGGPIGIPFITVPGSQTKYPASFLYADESDTGPYAVPLDAPIEGGSGSTGDRHAIAVDTDNCILYELYRAFPESADWTADSGAIFDLRSNALRPSSWTSADAAGLPIMPGLVTYEEVAGGVDLVGLDGLQNVGDDLNVGVADGIDLPHHAGVAVEAVAAGRGDRARADEHPGPRNVTALDRLLHADIGVARPLRLDVPDRRESLLEKAAGQSRGPGSPKGDALFQKLLVVVGAGRVEQDVRVRVDEPGQHREAGEVDHGRSGRHDRSRPRAHALDAPAAHDDRLVAAGRR
jgi:hypothetical protein